MTSDMRQVTAPKSDQMNADDLLGGSRTITISEVRLSPGTEQPVSVFFDGDEGKPYKPCKSMARVMMLAWGADAKQYSGRQMTLYNDLSVKWGGIAVGGIRISHLSHIDRDMVMALTATRGKKSPYTVKALSSAQPTVQLTLETAKDALNGAKDMDELKSVWSQKAMAPFRDELTDFLDGRKEALSIPSNEPPTEVYTESDDTPAWAGMVADWKERIEKADMVGTIIAIRGELKPHVDVLPSEVAHELYGLLDEAAVNLTTKGE